MVGTEFDDLINHLNEESPKYLRIVELIDGSPEQFEILYIREDVEEEHRSEEDHIRVIETILRDEFHHTWNYNIIRSKTSLLIQFRDGEGRDIIVSFDPHITDIVDIVALGDNCMEHIPGTEFSLQE